LELCLNKANAKSHTHSQFATANATPKIAKEYVLPTLKFELNNKHCKSRTWKHYLQQWLNAIETTSSHCSVVPHLRKPTEQNKNEIEKFIFTT